MKKELKKLIVEKAKKYDRIVENLKKYRSSDKFIKTRDRYYKKNKKEILKKVKERSLLPEVIERRRKYMVEYSKRDHVARRIKEYCQRPDVIERAKKYRKKYYKKNKN